MIRSGEKTCCISLTTMLPFNIQLVFLNVVYMHETFFIYRFTCKSKATISDKIKALFFNAFFDSPFCN